MLWAILIAVILLHFYAYQLSSEASGQLSGQLQQLKEDLVAVKERLRDGPEPEVLYEQLKQLCDEVKAVRLHVVGSIEQVQEVPNGAQVLGSGTVTIPALHKGEAILRARNGHGDVVERIRRLPAVAELLAAGGPVSIAYTLVAEQDGDGKVSYPVGGKNYVVTYAAYKVPYPLGHMPEYRPSEDDWDWRKGIEEFKAQTSSPDAIREYKERKDELFRRNAALKEYQARLKATEDQAGPNPDPPLPPKES
jgi:hypothetical protein